MGWWLPNLLYFSSLDLSTNGFIAISYLTFLCIISLCQSSKSEFQRTLSTLSLLPHPTHHQVLSLWSLKYLFLPFSIFAAPASVQTFIFCMTNSHSSVRSQLEHHFLRDTSDPLVQICCFICASGSLSHLSFCVYFLSVMNVWFFHYNKFNKGKDHAYFGYCCISSANTVLFTW